MGLELQAMQRSCVAGGRGRGMQRNACSKTTPLTAHGLLAYRHRSRPPTAMWRQRASAQLVRHHHQRAPISVAVTHAAAEAEIAPDVAAVAAEQAPSPPPELEQLPAANLERNAALVERLRGQLILAPLTRGGNLPFRRLCAAYGAEVTLSEMAFARQLLKGDRKELALLRRADNERCYGVQIATNVIEEGVRAGLLAAEAGADFLDLNCGCPIKEATRRGLGAALLRKPHKLARLVNGIAMRLPIPLTVKIRLGQSEDKINVDEMVGLLEQAGAAVVTVHGRTMEQRYKKAANWGLVEQVAAQHSVPLVGNGDVLTQFEARRRLDSPGLLAVMVGRGALIKPWLFQEVKEGGEMLPTASEQVGIYRQLVSYMKEHFKDDERGKRAAYYFLPWHFNFFTRYRPMPEAVYGAASLQQPLLSTRWDSMACSELGETLEGLSPLERLLRCENEAAYGPMADMLWDAGSDGDAEAALMRVAEANVAQWEDELRAGQRGGGREEAQAQG